MMTSTDPKKPLENRPLTPERLREIYGAPSSRVKAKVIQQLDKHCLQFIQHSTFLVIASSNGTQLDVSPKGDPAGFVKVETATSLLIPDRPGNNRIDGLMNIVNNPEVALLFMIPAVGETLRVNGTADIIEDPEICERFSINGRAPKTVLRVNTHEIFLHCGKAPMRSGLWKPDTWPSSRPVSSLSEIIREHAQVEVDLLSQEAIEEEYRKSLY